MVDFIDSFGMGSQYFITDEGFNIDDSPSNSTDEELGSRFSTNLGLIQLNTKVATSLEDLSKEEEEVSLRKFVHNLILKKGIRGKHLQEVLNRVYGSKFLKDHHKLLASYVKRDYLIGNIYDDLSPYATCVPLKKSIKRSSSSYIVKCGECNKCPYNIRDNCGAFGKNLVDSPSQIDYQKVGTKLGLKEKASVTSINAHLRTESESVKIPLVRASGHTVYNGNAKKESQYNLKNQIRKHNLSKMNWDQVRKVYKGTDVKKVLTAFLKTNIKEGTLDYIRMFSGCDTSELRNHRSFLKKIAYKYLADDSILGEVIDFYELPSLNKKLPTSMQDEPQWYNLRSDVEGEESGLYERGDVPSNKKKSSPQNELSLSWMDYKKNYPGADVRAILDQFVKTRLVAGGVNLSSMFEGSNLEEINHNIKASTKKILKNYKGFRRYFFNVADNSILKISKKEADLKSDLPCAVSGDSGDVLKTKCSSLKIEFKTLRKEFLASLNTKNPNNILRLIKKRNISPSDLSRLVKVAVKEFPETKVLCQNILDKLGAIKAPIKKSASSQTVKSTVDYSSLTLDPHLDSPEDDSILDIEISPGVTL
jgi:hypothetical protein